MKLWCSQTFFKKSWRDWTRSNRSVTIRFVASFPKRDSTPRWKRALGSRRPLFPEQPGSSHRRHRGQSTRLAGFLSPKNQVKQEDNDEAKVTSWFTRFRINLAVRCLEYHCRCVRSLGIASVCWRCTSLCSGFSPLCLAPLKWMKTTWGNRKRETWTSGPTLTPHKLR